jgi:hypothetical protein
LRSTCKLFFQLLEHCLPFSRPPTAQSIFAEGNGFPETLVGNLAVVEKLAESACANPALLKSRSVEWLTPLREF